MDYRVGAGGNLASEAVAKAKPDGYTILFGTAATHGVNAALYKKLPFDVEADFTPIAPMVNVSNVLTVNPEVIDASTLREFIDKVKANPGKYNYASTGNGTGTHLAFAEFVARAGLNMVHVPYKGGPGGAHLGGVGHDLLHLQPGADRDAAVRRRAGCGCWASPRARACRAVPDVPTIAEAGCRASRATPGSACSARRAWTAEIVNKVNAAVKFALETARRARPAGAARQHAALGIARAVPRHGEVRPRQVGGGGQGDRRDDRLTKYFVGFSSSSLWARRRW